MIARRMFLLITIVAAMFVALGPQQADADHQRYRHHNGYWWYQTDNDGWVYYNDGRWYNTRGSLYSHSGAHHHPYRYHNGYWWYQTGNDGWVYHRNGRWYDTHGSLYTRAHVGVDVGGGLRGRVDADVRTGGSAHAHGSPYRYHDGHWWYRNNNGGWVYYRDGSWFDTRGTLHSQGRGGVQIDGGNVIRDLDSNIRGNARGTFDGRGGNSIPRGGTGGGGTGGGVNIGGGLRGLIP